MVKLVLALVVFGLVESAAVATTAGYLLQAPGGVSALSERLTILLFVAMLLPPLLAYGVWRRFRSHRLRASEVARYEAAYPEAVVFGALATEEFIFGLNRVRQILGNPPLRTTDMPFVVSISKTALSIDQLGRARPRSVILLLSSMIDGVRAESFGSIETLHLTIGRGEELELFIPVETDGVAATTHTEIEQIAARVAATIELGNRV